MSVFRIEKTKDYTVMANHHLKNRNLSLKAEGLLTLMLSLPEEWDYSLGGLSHISKEGVDAIREGVRELEVQCATAPTMQIAGCDYSTEFLKERFASMNAQHIDYVRGTSSKII